MEVRYRPMVEKDIGECVEIIARHSILRSRYGKSIRHVGQSWKKLLGSDAFIGAVFEERVNGKWAILGAGLAVFVSDDFARELKNRSPFWIGPELSRRIAAGNSPVLTDRQVEAANSSRGLNLAVWQTGLLPKDLIRGEVGGAVMAAFVELLRGFFLKEVVTQAETSEHVDILRLTGAQYWNPAKGSFGEIPSGRAENLVGEPHAIGLSRELAVERQGSWAASLFLHRPPRFGFTRSERKLLTAALEGGTDQELSARIGVSIASVKKIWRVAYDRVASCSPELFPHDEKQNSGSSERGKTKKQRLLAYLREHPEELRPVARKLLRHKATSAKEPPA